MSKQQHRRFPFLLAAALLLVAAVGGFSLAKMSTLNLPEPLTARPAWDVAQDDDDESPADEVSPSQLDKYVSVYQAMQRDRSMTVDKATAQQHMTVAQFRD